MAANFFAHIFSSLQRQPSAERVVWSDGIGQTGEEILQHTEIARRRLESCSLSPGQEVLLLIHSGPALLAGILALFAAACPAVAPPPGFGLLELRRIVRSRNIAYAVTASPGPVWVRVLCFFLGVKQIPISLKTGPNAPALPPGHPVICSHAHPALVSHSSGSTGASKAIVRTHGILTAQHEALLQAFPPWQGQVDFPLFPNIVLHNLAAGRATVMPAIPGAKLRAFDPAIIINQIQRAGIQSLTGNPFYLNRLADYLDRHPLTFPAVKAVGVGGAPVPELLLRRLLGHFSHAQVYVIYGATEAEPISIRLANNYAFPPELGYAVGRVAPRLTLRIDAPAPGMIWVKGPHVASSAPDGWHPTGDFGYLNEENILFLTGRRGNERSHAGVMHCQVEHVLRCQQGVDQVAALARDSGFLVLFTGTADPHRLNAMLNLRFPKVPIVRIEKRRRLPLDPRHLSKVLYRKVRWPFPFH